MKDLFGFEIELDSFGTPKAPFKPAHSPLLNDISAEYLRSILKYDPLTGQWQKLIRKRYQLSKHPRHKYLVRKYATHQLLPKIFVGIYFERRSGRWRIKIGDTFYRAARLAWLYMTGEWPPIDVDHENNDPSDDRWKNLRLATELENARNKDVRNDSVTGIKGVQYRKLSGQYVARITVDGIRIYLGSFTTKERAAIAYLNAAIKYHGEFAKAQQSPKKDLF
jgi:hypothetical protein